MKNAAQRLSYKSVECINNKNKQAWLDLFSPDAVIQDPVGVSPLDPLGKGHKGREAIANFYDMTVGRGDLSIEILASFPAGNECANIIQMINGTNDENPFSLKMIVVYKVDENETDKLISLKAYWNFDQLLELINMNPG